MNIDLWILGFSAITVIVTIWMGFRSAKTSKTASDFFVAGRSVSVGWNASAISGEYLSAASFMGIAGMVMSSGYDALWYPVCYACGYLFLLLFIAGPLRRFGAYTIPDFAEGRFDSPLFRKIAVCFVLFIGFFYTMPQMKGAGTTLAYIFPGLPYWAGVVLVGAVITLNVALGGMKGITLVQAFQYWAKMFAISVPIFVLMAVYGHYGKQLADNDVNQGVPAVNEEYLVATNVIPVTGAFLQGSPKRFISELETVLAQTQPANLALLQLPLPELTAVQRKCDVSIALRLLAKHDLRQQWTYLPLRYSYAEKLEFNPATNSITPLPIEWFRSGFADAGMSFLESSNCLIVVPTPIYADLKHQYEKYGMAGLRSDRVAATAEGVLGMVEFAPHQDSASGLNLAGRLKHWWNVLRHKVTVGSRTDQAAPWAIMAEEVFSRISQTSGHKVWVAYELLAPENDDRNHGVWIQFPSKLSPSEWQKVAEHALETSGVVSSDGASPVGTNLCVIVRREGGDRFVLPANGVEKYARAGLLKQSNRVVLPTKAPADSTWLSPFGPLTTKAAKAAKLSAEESKPYSLLYTYSLIIALVCGTAGLPHILVRFYTNPDGVAAKRTTMWVMILIGIFYVFPPVFGVMGRNLFPDLYSGLGAKGTDKIVLELPRLLNAQNAPLGSILSGITCAGAFAAFMSTFSGLLVSMTGAMAHDVYGRMLRPKSTPEQRMKMFKIFAVVIGGVAMLLGSFVEALEINFMVGQAFAIAAASYFPLLFMAVWWRKLTMKGAATGMLAGGLSAVFAISLSSFSTLAATPGKTGEMFSMFKPLNDFWPQHPLLRILCDQPAIWAVPLAIGLMIIVSKLTQKDVPSDIRMKMLVLHAPEKLGLKQEYIQEHQGGGH